MNFVDLNGLSIFDDNLSEEIIDFVESALKFIGIPIGMGVGIAGARRGQVGAYRAMKAGAA